MFAFLPLLLFLLVALILIWDVVLAARIAQVRTLPRSFVTLSALAGFLRRAGAGDPPRHHEQHHGPRPHGGGLDLAAHGGAVRAAGALRGGPPAGESLPRLLHRLVRHRDRGGRRAALRRVARHAAARRRADLPRRHHGHVLLRRAVAGHPRLALLLLHPDDRAGLPGAAPLGGDAARWGSPASRRRSSSSSSRASRPPTRR